ncbi:MAG: IMPACT family protein [Anaerolineales bacterium]
MEKKKIVPAGKTSCELIVSKSRFIGSMDYASSIDEAREFIRSIQADFPDASHHVPAFIIGHEATRITHCSDAGEPAGSSGRPALAVLEGSGLGDVVVVVTRYFGGTKLGIGGLVRAYGDTVRELVAKTKRAQKVSAMAMKLKFTYPYVERIRSLILDNSGQVISEEFEVGVITEAMIPINNLDNFENQLANLTGGAASVTRLDELEVLVPINSGR